MSDASEPKPDWRHRARVLEALLLLVLARLAVDRFPFRRIAPLLGRIQEPQDAVPSAKAPGDAHAYAVRHALSAAARRLPWNSTCLVRTLAGRAMLVRRGVPTLARIGVAPDGAQARAHAWLIAGGIDVSGGSAAPDYVPIAEFTGKP